MKYRYIRSIIGALLLVAIVLAAYYFNIARYLSIERLRAHDIYIQQIVQQHTAVATFIYIAVFTFCMVLSLPVTAPLTVIGGYLFGPVKGSIYAIGSSTVGATISFVLFRYFLRDMIQERYAARLAPLLKQFKYYGANYLLLLHFLSVVPFFMINMLAAVTPVSITTFMWTTAAGILPLLCVYAFVGHQLHTIQSPRDVFSPYIIGMLLILGIIAMLPIIIRRYLNRRQSSH